MMNTHFSKIAQSTEVPYPETPAVIPGVGPDCPVGVTAGGGKQSDSPYMCEALPPLAILAIARVRKHGVAKYGFSNHEQVPPEKFLGHAIQHLMSYMAGDCQEDHLAHALCDLALMVEVVERERMVRQREHAIKKTLDEVFSIKKELGEINKLVQEVQGSSPT